MKLFGFITLFFLASYQATYALPVGIILLGGNFFSYLGVLFSTVFIGIYFYFKNVSLVYKILISWGIIIITGVSYLFIAEIYNNDDQKGSEINNILLP